MNKYLTDKQCQQILENRFQTQDIKLIDYELKPISKDAEGYMGEHFYLTIRYEQNGNKLKEILFVKRKPTNSSQAELADESMVYPKEILFYNVLLPDFEAKGYNTSFTAKSYLCIPDEAIILENLITKGYKIIERNQIFNVNQMKSALKALALYHGAGLACEKTKSKEIGKTYKFTDDYAEILKEKFFCQYLEQVPITMKWWDGCNNTILDLIKVSSKDEQFRNEFLDLYLNYPVNKIFADKTKFVKTCGHGDLWSNNMMFKFDGDSIECCLVDFQLVRYFYPAFDVILMIYANTDVEFREKYLQEMYDYYYDTLASIIKNYGHDINDIMTRDDFYQTLCLVKPECLVQVAFVKTVLYIPKEDLTDRLHKEDDSFETLIFNNSDSSVKLFEKDIKFRNAITETLHDLYEALMAKKKNVI